MTQYHYCRVCNRGHGLHIDRTDPQNIVVNPVPKEPLSLGNICIASGQALHARTHEDRFQTPQKKENGVWKKVSWEQALSEIGESFQKIRKEKGSSRIGLGLGTEPMNRSIDFVRAMGFGVSRGFGHIFSTLSEQSGPQRLMSEWMIGHPCAPLSDLSRAHNIIMLGNDPAESGWGQLGTWYDRAIQHSRRTKKTIVSSLSPGKGEFSSSIDKHIPIRPGTEPFFLLGMLNIILKSGWADSQYIDDHTEGLKEIQPYLEAWNLERCANICGIEAATLSGLSLKFARAAMAVIHPGVGTFQNHNAALGAWAWTAVHMITANALRPGGFYENLGAFDLYPALANLLMKDAPSSSSSVPSPLLMQTAFGFLPEIDLSAMLLLGTIPEYLLRKSVRDSIEKIDLLVVGARQPSWLTEQADWILPITHSFEEDDICVHRNPELPCLSLPRSEAVVSPYGESKSIDVILKELSGTFSSSFKGPWGNHLKLGSRPICNLDLHLWLERLLDFGQTNPLPRQADLRYQGESDRSLWRPEKNKIQFSVPVLKELFKNITIPTTSDDFPFLLHCSGSVDDAPDNAHRSAPLESFAAVHPDTGLATGMYQIKTRFGCIEVELRHDETLRTDVLRAPFARIPGVLDILPDTTSAYTGTPVLDGTPCSLSIIESQTNIDS